MISVRDLVCGYDESRFYIQQITFDIKTKEIVGIIGPNGSGKSTLLKGISNVLPIKHGKVLFDNRDIKHFNNKELAQEIAVVSQGVGELGYGFSVKEYVLLGRIPYRSRFRLVETEHDLEAAEKALMSVDLLKFKERDISHLSGGEKQRAAIARALCQEPKVLLLDEPTSSLDIGHQVEILDLLKKLNKNGLTVVMIMHDLNIASMYCDRLILLTEGKIHSTGTPEEIITKSIIEHVYGASVVIEKHPINSKPLVCLQG